MEDSQKLDILYKHYNDTFTYLREYVKYRDSLFFYLFIFAMIVLLQFSFPENISQLITALINKNLGSNISFNPSFLQNALLFLFLGILHRYYQMVITVERQYCYIHSLEERLNIKAQEENFISREGFEYLKNYPFFSRITHFLYIWVFPISLLVFLLIKMIVEFNLYSFAYWFSFVCTILMFASTISYLFWWKSFDSQYNDKSPKEKKI